MPRKRIPDLNELLKEVLGSDNVYFQPPETCKMKYPCIVYEISKIDTRFADNCPYVHHKRYKVVVIDKNPDSEIPDKLGMLPMCTFDRFFTSNNLNHFIYNLYY